MLDLMYLNILLQKNLMVLRDGVIEGRRVFGNIFKYIKMGASSNFGNMFSMTGASFLLPFLPMYPIQIILNNLNKLQACIPANKNIIDQFMYDNTGNQKDYFRKKENVVIKNTATPLSPPFTPPSSPPSTITMIKSWMGGGDTSKSDNYSDIPVATAIEGDDNLGSVQWGDVFF